MSFAGLLNSRITIQAEILGAKDGMGGYLPSTWGMIYQHVPYCFESLTERLEIVAYDKNVVYPDFLGYMEWRSGISEGNKIIKEDDNREFIIKLIENTKELGTYMKHAIVELGRNE